jgi:hypothetical protein
MNARSTLRRAALLAAICTGLCAHAQVFRAYLKSTGSDSNPCSVVAPCRLLPAALAAADFGGEVWMLDSANYNTGTVTITGAVSILAVPGAVGSVLSIGGPAIVVNAPGSTVALRNLVIVPFTGASGTLGIQVTSAAKFSIEDSVIAGNNGDGLFVSAATQVRVNNCTIRDNINGVRIQGGAAGEIGASRILNNSNTGISVLVTASTVTSAVISDSVIAGNLDGVSLFGNAAGSAHASITRSTISNHASSSGIAISMLNGASGVITVGANMITGNSIGMLQSGATAALESLGNNIVRQNSTPTAGTITTVVPL